MALPRRSSMSTQHVSVTAWHSGPVGGSYGLPGWAAPGWWPVPIWNSTYRVRSGPYNSAPEECAAWRWDFCRDLARVDCVTAQLLSGHRQPSALDQLRAVADRVDHESVGGSREHSSLQVAPLFAVVVVPQHASVAGRLAVSGCRSKRQVAASSSTVSSRPSVWTVHRSGRVNEPICWTSTYRSSPGGARRVRVGRPGFTLGCKDRSGAHSCRRHRFEAERSVCRGP
jgi:hypothetical protein